MSSTEHFPIPIVGASGEPCASCGTPLAADQRYCLRCGTRRGAPRLSYRSYLSQGPATSAGAANGAAPYPPSRANDVSPLGAVLGIALLGGMLLIGVLLGRGSDDSSQAPTRVVTVGGGATTTATAPEESPPASAETVVGDWPIGQSGWTVELGTLPKADATAADVNATKDDLSGQGATEVGVLDSDLYPSLPSGNYVLYNGVYDSEGEANSGLKKLKGFGDAVVVEVSAGPSTGGEASPQSNGGVGGSGTSKASPQLDLGTLEK